MKLKKYWEVLKESFSKFVDDNVPKLGASLSYYTVFSLAPLLIIIIAVAGFIFGTDAAQGRIYDEIESLVGKDSALLIQTAIKKSADTGAGILATVISFVTLIIGSVTVFIELQDSLNIIWKVKAKPAEGAIKSFLRTRFISFTLIISIGFLLLVSLVISAGLTALGNFFSAYVPVPVFVLQVLNNLLSLAVISVLFGMIFRILPDVELSWKDVRVGSIVTALLFVVGKYLIGLYIGGSTLGSTYGAAGSLAILLVWVFYSSQILFFGAEFTFVYAEKLGSKIMPSEHAVKVTVETVEHGKEETTAKNPDRGD
ncbi:MAG TPA: YihY/virulence factor BrkB family protein [Bacteroidota bacterium]|nr:YihY/virulence factor BrkB family protein [Bacteroidota bacterium]